MDFSNATVNVVKVESFWWKTVQRVVPKYPKDKPLFLFTSNGEARMYLSTIVVAEFFRGHGANVINRAAILSGTDPVPYIYFSREASMDAVMAIEEISPAFATWLMFYFAEIF